MMESTFREILSKLDETQIPETCLTTLIDLKEAVEKSNDKTNITVLWKGGYLKYLMNALYSSQKAVIDISLSILSSCTLDKDFARKAILDYNLVSQLYDLMCRCPDVESAKVAIFKILGNICKHNKRWALMMFVENPEFVELALELLKDSKTENVSEATLVAALRFLRTLLHDPRYGNVLLLILDTDLMEVVSAFFIEVILKPGINENILQQTIKLLYTYSPFQFHYSIEETLTGESIFYVCRRMRFFLQRIPRIISNTLKIHQLESPPLFRDMSSWIINKLEDLNIEDSKDVYVAHISCLCFMILEGCEEHHKKYLPHLIKVLTFVENPSYADVECIILIVMAFTKFIGDNDKLAQDLMDCGLVQILVEKLKWVSGKNTLTLDFDHQANENYFLAIPERPHALGNCNHPNPGFKEENAASSSNEKGEMYTKSDLGCPCSDNTVMDKMKKILHKEIISLFHSYTFFYPSMPQLTSEELITALLVSSVHFGRTCLYKNSLAGFRHLFRLMSTTDFMEKFCDMRDLDFDHDISCTKCRKLFCLAFNVLRRLEKLAISLRGMRKISRRLDTDIIDQKVGLILSIPYLFRDKSRIAHFLLQFDCLKCLAQLLKEGSSLKKRTIKVLHFITSRKLVVADPTQVDIAESTQETTQAPAETAAAAKILVTFKLDDGSTVQADRDLLTKRSWYFSVLLDGTFKESREEEVALRNTPIDLLRFMLQLLEHPEKIDRLVMEHDLDFLFDAFVFIDRHGQSDIRSLLMGCITKYKMNSKTVAAIYRWSILFKLDLLRTNAVTFALVHRFEEDNERFVMFDSLLDLGCTEELIGDIQKILEGSLRPHMKVSFDD